MTDQINPLRAMMVENIIAKNAEVPITVEALAPLLPDNFDLGEDDLEHYREAHPIEFEGEPTPAQREAADMVQNLLSGEPIIFESEAGQEPEAPTPELPPQAKALAATKTAVPEAEPIAPAPAPADPAAIEAAVIRRNKAEQDLANARVLQITENETERRLRTELAKAVTDFQASFPPITREQLMRDVIASEQERKANGHPLQPQGRPGKSVVDRLAFFGRGGNPARGDYRRGAFPASSKGAPNFNPARGAVAAQPKLPSER